MKRAILFLTCLMGMTFAFAQSGMQDVVYLKNGSIIRGDIVDMLPDDVVRIKTVDGSLFVYDYVDVERFAKEEAKSYGVTFKTEKKSPWAAGIMSYFVPGMGQLYNGESRKGWIDFATQIGGYAATLGGLGLAMEYSGYGNTYFAEDGTPVYEYVAGKPVLSTTGAILCLAGIVTIYANWIHTICDAVKSAKRINAENGYAMYQFNDRCAFGIQPSIAYECPQYLTCSKPELSAGMKFKLTF